MIEQFTRQVADNIVAQQDQMFEQLLVDNGLLTNADRKNLDIASLRKLLHERGYLVLESKETIGATTTFKLQLVKIVDTMQFKMTFKIDGVNFK